MRLSCLEQMLSGYSAEARVRIIKESGFDGIDCRFSTLEDPNMVGAIRNSGLPLASVYSQIRCPSILDAEASDRAGAIANIVHRACTAAQHGADNLILVPVVAEARLALDLDSEEIIALESSLLLVSLKEIADRLAEVPITVVVEPLNRSETHFLTDPTVAARHCDCVASPRIATMIDTYHCFEEHLDIVAQIDGVGKQLQLVHLSDSARGLPGEGDLDFQAVMSKLAVVSYTGWLGLECRQITSAKDEQCLTQTVAALRSMVSPHFDGA